MKKIVIILLVIPFVFSIYKQKESTDDLIRIRVLANSNSKYDLNIKNEISTTLKSTMYSLLKDVENIEIARNTIKRNMNNIENEIKEDLINESYSYKLNYGKNYFPEKKYNGKTYKEGEYESLLVTLGKGEGDNWWCILFPPFCLIEAEDSTEEVKYSFFLSEIFDNIFRQQ